MLGNSEWPNIIHDLLHGDAQARGKARTMLWQEVTYFVLSRLRLPIGRLGDDDEVRRDIAVRVIAQLERNDHQIIHEWEARQRRRRDASQWWTFVKMITECRAIDFARCSKLRVSSRKDGLRFAVVVPAEPSVLAELPSTGVLASYSEAELIEMLERLNASRAGWHWNPDHDLTAKPAKPLKSAKPARTPATRRTH
jgi:hypothetical protein